MSTDTSPPLHSLPVWDLPQRLDLAADIAQLKQFITIWVEESDREVRDMVRWQLLSTPKYFRPVTIFACHHAIKDVHVPLEVFRSVAALELIHNVSLIVDGHTGSLALPQGKVVFALPLRDIACVDGSWLPRCWRAVKLTAEDAYSIALLTGLLQRLWGS